MFDNLIKVSIECELWVRIWIDSSRDLSSEIQFCDKNDRYGVPRLARLNRSRNRQLFVIGGL